MPMLASPSRSLPDTRCGAAATTEERSMHSEAATRMPPPAPAVYRELGGVPSPPNLRAESRAEAAPGKGVNRAAAHRALAGGRRAWQAQQGSSGWARQRDGQRAGRHATWRWCRRRFPDVNRRLSTQLGTDVSGTVVKTAQILCGAVRAAHGICAVLRRERHTWLPCRACARLAGTREPCWAQSPVPNRGCIDHAVPFAA
jgi:hypothetical protein